MFFVYIQSPINIYFRHGAEVVEDHGSEKKRNTAAFEGSGFKLGDQPGSSSSVPAGL